MTTWIALFRGINVGGNHALPMAKLKSDLESLEFTDVRTYIQSGNVVFQSAGGKQATLAKKIGDLIHAEHGFRPHVLLLSRDALQSAWDANPFPEALAEPTSLHFYFLSEPAKKANLAAIEQAKAASENYHLTDGVFYLNAPDGVGRSKLAATAEKHLGVVTTARNVRTVQKLLDMVSSD